MGILMGEEMWVPVWVLGGWLPSQAAAAIVTAVWKYGDQRKHHVRPAHEVLILPPAGQRTIPAAISLDGIDQLSHQLQGR